MAACRPPGGATWSCDDCDDEDDEKNIDVGVIAVSFSFTCLLFFLV